MKVSIQMVRKWVKDGELAVVRVGKREYRIRESTLNEFIAERKKNVALRGRVKILK